VYPGAEERLREASQKKKELIAEVVTKKIEQIKKIRIVS